VPPERVYRGSLIGPPRPRPSLSPTEILLLLARVARKLAIAYFQMYVFLLVAGREVITLLFTSQYAASWPIFPPYPPTSVLARDSTTRHHIDAHARSAREFGVVRRQFELVAARSVEGRPGPCTV
jgi:hypothetical protein